MAACTRPKLAIQRKARRPKANDDVQTVVAVAVIRSWPAFKHSGVRHPTMSVRTSSGLERQLLPLSIMHHELALANIAIRLTVRAFRSSEAQL